MNHVTILAGGTGAAKFVAGLTDVLPEEQVQIIVNVGNDRKVWGLHVSPDIDGLLLALSGELDPHREWARRGETFHCWDTMRKIGMPSGRIGDRDLATHLVRTRLLAEGASLEDATLQLADRFGLGVTILPATSDPLTTVVQVADRCFPVPEYLERKTCPGEPTGVRYQGAEAARASDRVIRSIDEASRIIVAPAEPVSGIGAILAVGGIREALTRTSADVIAVSPVVGSQMVKGAGAVFMKAAGSNEVSARAVAGRYRDFLDHLVIHTTDVGALDQVRETGVGASVENILLHTLDDAARLARRIVNRERFAASR